MKMCATRGVLFMGMGVSGGEEGARRGPSLMPGGPREAFDAIAPALRKVAAQVDGPCTTYVGPGGAGNYVKMVHNGIEYGDMQLIAEAYDLLSTVGGLSTDELATVFDEWNAGELQSFLIEITAQIFKTPNDRGSGALVDYILDQTGMKGTGKWTVQQAAELSVAAPTIAAALDARFISGIKPQRTQASEFYARMGCAPAGTDRPAVDKKQLVEDVRAALYASKICSYAQVRTGVAATSGVTMGGLQPGAGTAEGTRVGASTAHGVHGGLGNPMGRTHGLAATALLSAPMLRPFAQGMNIIKAKSAEQGWGIQLGELARIWKGGCIIRAKFLDRIKSAYDRNADLSSLLVDDDFAKELVAWQAAWRRVIAMAVQAGVGVPGMMSSLSYFDSYRRARLPANLVQAQRDYFGSHTYQRTDDASGEWFHTVWSEGNSADSITTKGYIA